MPGPWTFYRRTPRSHRGTPSGIRKLVDFLQYLAYEREANDGAAIGWRFLLISLEPVICTPARVQKGVARRRGSQPGSRNSSVLAVQRDVTEEPRGSCRPWAAYLRAMVYDRENSGDLDHLQKKLVRADEYVCRITQELPLVLKMSHSLFLVTRAGGFRSLLTWKPLGRL